MNLDKLIEIVAQHYGYSIAELLEKGRHRRITIARQRIYTLARIRLGLTFQEIGMKFNRHHASIIHGVRRVQSDMQIYKKDKLAMRDLELILDMYEKSFIWIHGEEFVKYDR